MILTELRINGFRCFDANNCSISLNKLSTFVGPNASGKTAVMLALARMFGVTPDLRRVVPSDFHLSHDERLEAEEKRTLTIEVRLDLPEFDDGGDRRAIPEVFNQMIVDDPGERPYCRIRLTATWTNDGTLDGDVEQRLEWIKVPPGQPDEENRSSFNAGTRGKIALVYIPAVRDPERLLKATTENSFGQLLRAIDLANGEDRIAQALDDLRDSITDLQGISTITAHLQELWATLYHGRHFTDVDLQAVGGEVGDFLRQLKPVFLPDENGGFVGVKGLSDGYSSLFTLSLSLAVHSVQRALVNGVPGDLGFHPSTSNDLPILTIFAVEEPENHLSPHYLGRIIERLKSVSNDNDAQVIVSSHSPAILSRVEPENVRYIKGNEHSVCSEIIEIPLPEQKSEAYKFVREAIRAYPELYFSRLVVLGEGPSEEIVLKRLFAASDQPLDSSFISVVPLGGRHVNHFWRLLSALNIPYLTLLDLDREKNGAGWRRIKYVRDQLLKIEDLIGDMPDNRFETLRDECFDQMKDRPDENVEAMKKMLCWVETNFNIFFSEPLDLDFSMLECFPEVFQNGKLGPRLSSDNEKREAEIQSRVAAVLGTPLNGLLPGHTYKPEQLERFAWYKYLFVDNSKPVAHLEALAQLSDSELRGGAPDVLQNLVRRATDLLAELESGGIR